MRSPTLTFPSSLRSLPHTSLGPASAAGPRPTRLRVTLALLALAPGALAQGSSHAISDDWAQRSAPPLPAEQGVRAAVRDAAQDGRTARQDAGQANAGTLRPGHGKYGEIYRTERQDKIDAAFKAAETPGCLSQDAMKHGPPKIGPVGFGGVLALPFLAAAAVKGKCK